MNIVLQALLLALFVGTGLTTQISQTRCTGPSERGPCNNFSVKWYYDRYSHRCREFYYGGCQGNGNRFDTLEECKNTCDCEEEDPAVAMCMLPFDKGNCTSEFERWYFDARMNQCTCGTWSGCGGNANRFYSYDHCMKSCGQFVANSAAPSQHHGHAAAGVTTYRENVHSNNWHTVAGASQKMPPLPENYRNMFASGSVPSRPTGDRRFMEITTHQSQQPIIINHTMTVPVGNVTWTKLFHRQRTQYVEDPTSGQPVIVALEHHTGAVRNGKLINEHRYKYSAGNTSLPGDGTHNMTFSFPPIPDPMGRKQPLPPVPGIPEQMISLPSRQVPPQNNAGAVHHQSYNRPQVQPHAVQPVPQQQHAPHPPQHYVPQTAPHRPLNPQQPSPPHAPPRYPQAQPPAPHAPRYPQHPPMIPPQAPAPFAPAPQQRPQVPQQQPSLYRYPVRPPAVHPDNRVPHVPQAPHRLPVSTPRPYPPQSQHRPPAPQTPAPYVPRHTPPPPTMHPQPSRLHNSRYRFPVKSSHPIRTTQATILHGQVPRVPPAVAPRPQGLAVHTHATQTPPTTPPHPHVNRPPVPNHPPVIPSQIPHPQVPQVMPSPIPTRPPSAATSGPRVVSEQELRERDRIERERRRKLKKDALFAKLKQQEKDWKLQQRVKNLKNGQAVPPDEPERIGPQQPVYPQPRPKVEPPRPTPPRAPATPPARPPQPQPPTPPPQPYRPREPMTTVAPLPPPTTTRPTTTRAPTTTPMRHTTPPTKIYNAVPHADKKLDKQTNQEPRSDDSYSEEYMDDGRDEYEDVPDALQFFLRNKNQGLVQQVETTDPEPDGYVYADDETDNNWMETDLRPSSE